jgi:hypothetical protein
MVYLDWTVITGVDKKIINGLQDNLDEHITRACYNRIYEILRHRRFRMSPQNHSCIALNENQMHEIMAGDYDDEYGD